MKIMEGLITYLLKNDEWFALYPCLCYTEQKVLMKT